MLHLTEQHADLARQMALELADIERRFAAELVSDLPCVNDLVRHLEKYRGKMLRPMLVVLCGMAADPARPVADAHRTLAVVVEMVHMATLVHDDVLDEQDVRRRIVTVNYLHGNETAVMLGDYLISHAYHLCSSLARQDAARLIARTTNIVCEGELLQLSNRNNWSLDEKTYFEVIRRKTASLCGVSCRLGAMASESPAAICDTLARYGELLGTAFQIIDDVLDLAGDAEVVGKTLGKDLEKGKLTLPLIRHLQTVAGPERDALVAMLNQPNAANYRQVAELLAGSDAMAYARQRAEALVDEARTCLSPLPDSAAKASLITMAGAVISRSF